MGGRIALLIALTGVVLSGAESGTVTLKAVPRAMHWTSAPVSFAAKGDDAMEIVAPPKTDWYVSPLDGETHSNAPWLLFDADADFVLRAKVTVDYRTKWDAGALVAWIDNTHWVKFAFENAAWLKPTIVSVVTRGRSDDSNAYSVDGNVQYLEIAKLGEAMILYASDDGRNWHMIRAFTLGQGKLQVGFSSQSPVGQGHRAVFSEIRYRAEAIKDIWKGE